MIVPFHFEVIEMSIKHFEIVPANCPLDKFFEDGLFCQIGTLTAAILNYAACEDESSYTRLTREIVYTEQIENALVDPAVLKYDASGRHSSVLSNIYFIIRRAAKLASIDPEFLTRQSSTDMKTSITQTPANTLNQPTAPVDQKSLINSKYLNVFDLKELIHVADKFSPDNCSVTFIPEAPPKHSVSFNLGDNEQNTWFQPSKMIEALYGRSTDGAVRADIKEVIKEKLSVAFDRLINSFKKSEFSTLLSQSMGDLIQCRDYINYIQTRMSDQPIPDQQPTHDQIAETHTHKAEEIINAKPCLLINQMKKEYSKYETIELLSKLVRYGDVKSFIVNLAHSDEITASLTIKDTVLMVNVNSLLAAVEKYAAVENSSFKDTFPLLAEMFLKLLDEKVLEKQSALAESFTNASNKLQSIDNELIKKEQELRRLQVEVSKLVSQKDEAIGHLTACEVAQNNTEQLKNIFTELATEFKKVV